MAQTEAIPVQDQSMRRWMDHILTMIMVAGGVATVAWIAAMLVAGWQMAVVLLALSSV